MTALIWEKPPVIHEPNLTNPQAVEGFFDPEIVYHEDVAKIDGAKVRYRVYEPVEASEDTPIHIRNGYMASGPAYYAIAEELAKLGRWTVVTESVRSQWSVNVLDTNVLRLQAKAGYAAMRDVAYWLNTPKADILAHSMGGVVANMIAEHHPHRVRSISYTGAAAQDGEHTLMNRAHRIPGVINHQVVPNISALRENSSSTTQLAVETLKYIFPHVLRTIGEGVQVARADNRAVIPRLRQLGIATGAVLMEHDGFFELETMKKVADELHDLVVVIPEGIHIDPNINPRPHAELQVDVFDELNYHERINHLRIIV